MKSNLAKLVIFGDPKKGEVSEVIAEFTGFVKGKAEVIASCGIEECTNEVLKEANFAIVFGGDGSMIRAASMLWVLVLGGVQLCPCDRSQSWQARLPGGI